MKRNKIALLITALLLLTMACLCTNTAPSSSGYITQVTMARDTQGDLMEPVDPTTVFDSDSVIHAVVKIADAPDNTVFTADFYGADAANTLIGSTDVTAGGSRYIDFTLTPASSWPAGSYYVNIKVNGVVNQKVDYTVQ